MKITETKLNFSSLMPRKSTKRIIVHHAATNGDVTAQTVHGWHLNNGWSGIGYHYLIRTNGEIQRGRPEHAIGSHVAGANSDSIGICLAGNFSKQVPSTAQLGALVDLVHYLQGRYGSIPVIGHSDAGPSECPGKFFPWPQLRQMLEGKELRLLINGKETAVPIRNNAGRVEAKLSGSWVQIRELSNLLGASLAWNAETKTASMEVE